MSENLIRNRTFAEVVEELIKANIMLTNFDHRKAEELSKPSAERNMENIAKWEAGSRTMNERRAAARAALDEYVEEIVSNGEYHYLCNARTFG